MIPFFISFLTCLSAFFRSRYNLGLEILALRQQLGILKRKQPLPRLRIQDRIFWIMLRPLNVAIRLWYLCVAEPSVRRQIPFTSVS